MKIFSQCVVNVLITQLKRDILKRKNTRFLRAKREDEHLASFAISDDQLPVDFDFPQTVRSVWKKTLSSKSPRG